MTSLAKDLQAGGGAPGMNYERMAKLEGKADTKKLSQAMESFVRSNSSEDLATAAGDNLGDGNGAGGGQEGTKESVIPNPKEDARGYVSAVLMPYLLPGFEELLHVAKEKGELHIAGHEDDSPVGGAKSGSKGISNDNTDSVGSGDEEDSEDGNSYALCYDCYY